MLELSQLILKLQKYFSRSIALQFLKLLQANIQTIDVRDKQLKAMKKKSNQKQKKAQDSSSNFTVANNE